MSKLYFTVRFGIDKTWIADGFNINSEQAKEMLARTVHAYNHEISAVVTERLPQKEVARLQGYKTLNAMKAADRKK